MIAIGVVCFAMFVALAMYDDGMKPKEPVKSIIYWAGFVFFYTSLGLLSVGLFELMWRYLP